MIDTASGRYILLSKHDYISQALMEKGQWEKFLVDFIGVLLRERPGDVLDIGANLGAIAVPVARAFPDSHVYCFEAQRFVYQQLCGNAVLNNLPNIYPFHLAIGGPEDDGQMMDVPIPDYARDDNIGAISVDSRVNAHEGKTYERHEKVALAAVDSLGLANISVIKIDIEGYEYKALRGMERMLAANGYPSIIFEIWRDEKYPWMKEEKEAMRAFLEKLGYKVTIFDQFTIGIARHDSMPPLEFGIK